MGGFHYFAHDEPLYPVEYYDIPALNRDGILTMPDNLEIQDNSKENPLINLVAVLQALWLITQCVTKAVKSLPITRLELLTCSYVMVAAVLLRVWRDKPRHISHPIQVSIYRLDQLHRVKTVDNFKRPLSYINRVKEGLYKTYIFIPNEEELLSFVCSHLVGGVFSAILCLAWTDDYSTSEMLTLWRFCSLAGFSFFFALLVVCPTLIILDSMKILKVDVAFLGYKLLVILITVLYIGVRIVTIILAVKDLKLAPPRTFEEVLWSGYIPHI